MRKFIFTICILLFLQPCQASGTGACGPRDHGSWWVREYGVLSPSSHPGAAAAHKVFDRVLAAADKRANLYPRLLVIRKTGDPWAISLKDGTIILTRQALDICYRNVDKKIGAARLAFVLGHELAHLAKDDFWHMAAFDAVQRFGRSPDTCRKICDLLVRSEGGRNTARAREILKKKELQADGYGLLYAAMAGYTPKAIVDRHGKNFFREWTDQITGETAYADTRHPAPEQRAAFLLANMRAVKETLILFHLGVRLYQLGRYEDALDFLKTFHQKFPCREVSNNIGLAHYQMAMKALAEHEPDRVRQYRLSTLLDTETRARIYMERGQEEADFKKAIEYFRLACQKDLFYTPARVNLASALIMKKKYSEAMAITDEALQIRKNDPAALNNRAIAMYLLGPSIQVDMFRQATGVLTGIIGRFPGFSDARYNLGRLRLEHKRASAARKAWAAYLKLEPSGIYADRVRKDLGMGPAPVPKGTDRVPLRLRNPLPIRPGDPDHKVREQLKKLTCHSLELGTTLGDCYSAEGIRVLVLDGVVELIERRIRERISSDQIRAMCGQPRRTFDSPAGFSTLVYGNFALDIQNNAVKTIVHFER